MVPLAQGDGFWMLDPDAGFVLRHCRIRADAGTDRQTGRCRSPGILARCTVLCAHGGRRRADVGLDRRLQPRVPISVVCHPGPARVRSLRKPTTSRACASPTCLISPISASSRKSTISAGIPRCRCAMPAPLVEEIAFDISDGKSPYPGMARAGGWSANNSPISVNSKPFGANLKGNVRAGLKVTPLDFGASEQKRQEPVPALCEILRTIRSVDHAAIRR